MASLGKLLLELGINSGAFTAGLDKATYQARQFGQEVKGTLNDLRGSLSGLGDAFGGLGGPISSAMSAIQSSVNVAGTAIKGFTSGTISGFAGVAIGAVALVGAAVSVAGAWAYLATQGADVVENLERMSTKTGLSINDLQAFGAAAADSGGSLEDVTNAFKKFNRSLADGQKEGSAANIVLHNLGVTAKEPKEAFLQTIDALEKMSNKSLQASYAQQLFGRSFQDLIADFPEGSKNIEDAAAQVASYGAVIDSKAVQSTSAYKQSLENLSLAWDHLKVSATGALPALSAVLNVLAAGVKNPFGLGSGPGSFSGGGTPTKPAIGPQLNAADSAAAAEADKQQAAALQAQEDAYTRIKTGGEAGLALEKQQLLVAEAVKAQDYERAAALEAQIPALQEASRLEKERTAAIFNLPKTSTAAISKDSIEQTKAFGDAMRALAGTSGIEAAAAADTANKIEQFSSGTNAAIVNTKAFAEALDKLKPGFAASSLATEFSKAIAETGKSLDEFTGKQRETNNALEAEGQTLGKVADEQAKNTASLTPLIKKVADAQKAFDDFNTQVNANGKASVSDAAQLAQMSDELNKLKGALDTAKSAVDSTNASFKSTAVSEAQKNAQLTLQTTQATTSALLAGGEAYAKIDQQVKQFAKDTGATVEEQAAYRTVLEETNTALLQQTALAKIGQGPQIQSLQTQITYLEQIETQWQAAGKDVQGVQQAILQLEAEQAKLQADTGSFSAGIHAGYLQWAADIKTNAQLMQTLVPQALNGIADNLSSVIATGKAKWGDLVNSMEEALLKSQISSLIKQIFNFANNNNALSGLFGGQVFGSGGAFGAGGGGVSQQAAATTLQTGATTLQTAAATLQTSAAALQSAAATLSSSGAGADVSGAAGGDGGGSDFLSNILGGGIGLPGFADGGDVMPGKPIIVGEKRPEVFVPGSAGRILPTVGGGGSNTTVNMNVQAPDADSFRKSSSQMLRDMMRTVSTQNARNRGGYTG